MYRIYRYISPNNKSYIGQTNRTLDARAGTDGKSYINKCPKFGRAILKYGWDWFKNHREILKDDLTAEQANYWEVYYIGYYHSIDEGYNISIGGQALDSIANKRPVVGIDCSNHKIKIFESVSEAARYVDSSYTCIIQCLEHKSRTSHGYVWMDLEEYNSLTNEAKEEIFQIIPNQYLKPCKPIMCIETGEYFNSIKDAAMKYKIDSSWLSKAARGMAKTAGGKHWRFV